jgi:DNA-binding MarR family transcriptional regulator
MPTEWLTDPEQQAWRGLLRMHAELTRELERRLASESDLSYQDYEVLVSLTDQADGRLRLHELADHLGWERSRLSHHIARMARRGYVEKVPCESDRRGAFVAVTEQGRKAIEAAAPGHVQAVRELFIDPLSPSQLTALSRAAAAVLAPFAGGGTTVGL